MPLKGGGRKEKAVTRGSGELFLRTGRMKAKPPTSTRREIKRVPKRVQQRKRRHLARVGGLRHQGFCWGAKGGPRPAKTGRGTGKEGTPRFESADKGGVFGKKKDSGDVGWDYLGNDPSKGRIDIAWFQKGAVLEKGSCQLEVQGADLNILGHWAWAKGHVFSRGEKGRKVSEW